MRWFPLKHLGKVDVVLQLEVPVSDNVLGRSRIIAKGRDTGQVVDGLVLEAAIAWRDCTLLFVTDDTPFEEFLRIYLFDPRWHLLDRAAIGAMYATGLFSMLELRPPNALGFQFFSDTNFRLDLLDSASFSLPFSDPPGVSRPFGFYRRFIIRACPIRKAEV